MLIGEVIEKFGKNVKMSPINSQEFKMSISANPLGFKLWAMRNLDMVTVTKPQSLINDIKAVIENAAERYKN